MTSDQTKLQNVLNLPQSEEEKKNIEEKCFQKHIKLIPKNLARSTDRAERSGYLTWFPYNPKPLSRRIIRAWIRFQSGNLWLNDLEK